MIRNPLALAASLLLALLLAAFPTGRLTAAEIPEIGVEELQKVIDGSRGRVVLVNFWATWCGPCRRELPDLARLRRAFPENELAMISVSLDFDRDMLQDFLNRHPIKYQVFLADGKLMGDLKLDAIPKTWIFSPEGMQVQNHDGPATFEEMRSAIQGAKSARRHSKE